MAFSYTAIESQGSKGRATARLIGPERDLESADNFFDNDTIRKFSWKNVTVTVRDRKTRESLKILQACDGHVEAGQVVALMGPSGSGKTTLLNVLADRSNLPCAGKIMVNGHESTRTAIRRISSYVEQEDALIGSLTVEETIDFTARLSSSTSKRLRQARNEDLLHSLGLHNQRSTLVGTPLRKGISGGQKRRLSVAVQLLAGPKILFLDEPTSGLDSVASYEVMSFISQLAKKHRLLVIASIHQPSASTFELFDQVLLMAKGRTCYFGPTTDVADYFASLYPIPLHTNPAEYLLELLNTDFMSTEKDSGRVNILTQAWTVSVTRRRLHSSVDNARRKISHISMASTSGSAPGTRPSFALQPLTLLHRSWIKSYRDFLTYGTRVLMYTGLAIMMGTVWVRLSYTQANIQPFINAIFFGGAFMSFMAVAYIPAIGEDIAMLRKEFANGLYGAGSFAIANFLIGLPWLFAITLIFSIISYWLSNFLNTAAAFWLWVAYLFLDLLAAESLVVLVTALSPNFVIALAVTAFANGLWMAVGGFLVPLGTLNAFYKYVFHYIDYQAYVFQGMMVNQFNTTVYACATINSTAVMSRSIDATATALADAQQLHTSYQCMYASDLASQGQIRGTAILEAYHYANHSGIHGEWVGIMIAIIFVYRVLGYSALWWRARRR